MDKKNASDIAYESIQELIVSMKIKPGENITESDLIKLLKIGRTPVREALARLESEGLIHSNKGRKTVYKLTPDEVYEIFDVKWALEGAIVRWAAERGSPEDKRRLHQLVSQMKSVAKKRPNNEDTRQQYLDNWLELDRELHRLIFTMANSKKASQFIEQLNMQWHRMRISIYILEGRIYKSAEEHQEFVSYIVKGNGEKAEESMRKHLKNIKTEIINFMNLFGYQN